MIKLRINYIMSAAHDATNREMQLRLKDEDDLRLVETASAWCASKGILMGAARAKKEGNNIYSASRSIYNNALLLEPAPITLRPTPFSKQAYEQALAMGLPFQHVVHAIASSFYNNNTHDNINAVNTTSTGQEGGWLSQAIQTAAMGDKEFTGRLVQLAQEVAANPHDRAQTVTLGILRSDYMMHSPEDNGDGAAAASSSASSSSPLSLDRVQTAIPLQVELNTIASSFGCLSTKISKLHQVLNNNQTSPDQLPDNHVTDGLASGLAAAIHEYTRQKAAQAQHETTSNPTTPIVVVMVVQPGEANSIDQVSHAQIHDGFIIHYIYDTLFFVQKRYWNYHWAHHSSMML
jgi:glutathione synthase